MFDDTLTLLSKISLLWMMQIDLTNKDINNLIRMKAWCKSNLFSLSLPLVDMINIKESKCMFNYPDHN